MKFENKIIIITGAANGIGRVLSLSYAKEGATVILIDKDLAALESLQEVVKREGGKSIYYELDITDVSGIENTFKRIKGTFGKVDTLINNAGIGKNKSVFELLAEEWDYVVNTNLRGTFFCAREAAKIMRDNKGGSIVNIASTRALMSETDTIPYSASKGGILSLTHSLAVSLGKYHIRVNSISPGWIETGDYSNLTDADHHQHPAGRVGQPKDIVKACFFLSDTDNDFITGANLVVDGGMTVKMIYKD